MNASAAAVAHASIASANHTAPIGTRRAFFAGPGFLPCPVYERAGLRPGDALRGPLIVEQMDTTTIVPLGFAMTVDAEGNLLITFGCFLLRQAFLALPQDIFDKAKPYMRFGELISWVEVKELRKNNQVLLEFWCSGWRRKYPRYTVFHILVDENPDWTVEGDLGRGANMKW